MTGMKHLSSAAVTTAPEIDYNSNEEQKAVTDFLDKLITKVSKQNAGESRETIRKELSDSLFSPAERIYPIKQSTKLKASYKELLTKLEDDKFDIKKLPERLKGIIDFPNKRSDFLYWVINSSHLKTNSRAVNKLGDRIKSSSDLQKLLKRMLSYFKEEERILENTIAPLAQRYKDYKERPGSLSLEFMKIKDVSVNLLEGDKFEIDFSFEDDDGKLKWSPAGEIGFKVDITDQKHKIYYYYKLSDETLDPDRARRLLMVSFGGHRQGRFPMNYYEPKPEDYKHLSLKPVTDDPKLNQELHDEYNAILSSTVEKHGNSLWYHLPNKEDITTDPENSIKLQEFFRELKKQGGEYRFDHLDGKSNREPTPNADFDEVVSRVVKPLAFAVIVRPDILGWDPIKIEWGARAFKPRADLPNASPFIWGEMPFTQENYHKLKEAYKKVYGHDFDYKKG